MACFQAVCRTGRHYLWHYSINESALQDSSLHKSLKMHSRLGEKQLPWLRKNFLSLSDMTNYCYLNKLPHCPFSKYQHWVLGKQCKQFVIINTGAYALKPQTKLSGLDVPLGWSAEGVTPWLRAAHPQCNLGLHRVLPWSLFPFLYPSCSHTLTLTHLSNKVALNPINYKE